MEDYIINLIIFGVISWSTLFMLTRKLFPKRSFDFCNRIVSTIHATLAIVLASQTVQDWRCPVCPVVPSSPTQMRTLAVSIAYLIYDMVCCIFDKQNGLKLDNAVHHIVCIVGGCAGLAYKKILERHHRVGLAINYLLIDVICASEMVAAMWITELSSPFLHLRVLLKELGYKDTDLNLAADIMFAGIFTVARMVGGPYLTYVTLTADNPFLIKATALGLQLVSAYWVYKIARMVMYKLSKRASSKKVQPIK